MRYLTQSNILLILKRIIYVYVSFLREKKNLPSEKKKKLSFEKLWTTFSIDFKKKERSVSSKKKNYNLILLEREKKKERKKIRKLFGRKFPLSNESFSFVSVTKERKKKRLGERLVNDGHNCGLLSQ